MKLFGDANWPYIELVSRFSAAIFQGKSGGIKALVSPSAESDSFYIIGVQIHNLFRTLSL